MKSEPLSPFAVLRDRSLWNYNTPKPGDDGEQIVNIF